VVTTQTEAVSSTVDASDEEAHSEEIRAAELGREVEDTLNASLGTLFAFLLAGDFREVIYFQLFNIKKRLRFTIFL